MKKEYKLLTPGPLTTTESVKREMLFDHCTWDNDYKKITLKIREQLLDFAMTDDKDYTAVLMQGSGTFGVESVLSSIVKDSDRILIITNGAYGDRLIEIAEHNRLNYSVYQEAYDKIPSVEKVAAILDQEPKITHVVMVHSETTTGILNDIENIGQFVHKNGKTFIVDAMSSFGGIEIPVAEWKIDFLISSSNKCIQGVPGFSFIIANKNKLLESKGTARSLSLDLYSQWEEMQKDGKWRYTSPTHSVLAFAKAIEELHAEGGITKRAARYRENNKLLISEMQKMGFHSYIDEQLQGPIITTFVYPENRAFSFQDMYTYIKERGYAIYPGKLTDADTFRIGNIGEIYQDDIYKLCSIIQEYLKEEV